VSLFGKQKDDEPQATSHAAALALGMRGDTENRAPARAGRGDDRESEQMANIGKSITIKGDLTGNEDLVIEGTVEGKVSLPDNQLTVGANGTVTAEIAAKAVVVIGKVDGDVKGTERIEIQATGVVQGDVTAPRLVVAEGAVLNGSIQMTGGAGSASSTPPPAPKPAEARKAG
jgi:cytoskeletal protein CcmA (bactofilin family)